MLLIIFSQKTPFYQVGDNDYLIVGVTEKVKPTKGSFCIWHT
jgi:hypothetical protein